MTKYNKHHQHDTTPAIMHYRTAWIMLGILYIAFILLASLAKVPQVNIPFSHTDKIIHSLMYFILVGWFVQLYKKKTMQLFILLAAVLLGLLIEIMQGMTSYRSFDYADEIANSIGAVCAFLLSGTFFTTLLSRFDVWLYNQQD